MEEKSCDLWSTKHIDYVPSTFSIHRFTGEISEREIIYQVVKMEDSLLILINNKDNMHLVDLSLAMLGRHDNRSVVTRLMGNFRDESSTTMANRLTKKLQKAVLVSYNADVDDHLVALFEKRICEEIKARPDAFGLK